MYLLVYIIKYYSEYISICYETSTTNCILILLNFLYSLCHHYLFKFIGVAIIYFYGTVKGISEAEGYKSRLKVVLFFGHYFFVLLFLNPWTKLWLYPNKLWHIYWQYCNKLKIIKVPIWQLSKTLLLLIMISKN